MLLRARAILRSKLSTIDEDFGRLSDQYVDDREWSVRYFVADTGTWLPGRLVLISPVSVEGFDVNDDEIRVNLTKSQIEKSPSIQEAKPVSRQMEEQLAIYYQWPQYWMEPRGGGVAAAGDVGGTKRARGTAATDTTYDPALRSVNTITGYHIDAVDGEIGHLEDLLIDSEGWVVRYIVVDTRNWLPGKKVLLLPGMIEAVDWSQRKVRVALPREDIRNAPELDPDRPISREDEERLLTHYERPVYW